MCHTRCWFLQREAHGIRLDCSGTHDVWNEIRLSVGRGNKNGLGLNSRNVLARPQQHRLLLTRQVARRRGRRRGGPGRGTTEGKKCQRECDDHSHVESCCVWSHPSCFALSTVLSFFFVTVLFHPQHHRGVERLNTTLQQDEPQERCGRLNVVGVGKGRLICFSDKTTQTQRFVSFVTASCDSSWAWSVRESFVRPSLSRNASACTSCLGMSSASVDRPRHAL